MMNRVCRLRAKAGGQGLHLSHTPVLTEYTPVLTLLGPSTHIIPALFSHCLCLPTDD